MDDRCDLGSDIRHLGQGLNAGFGDGVQVAEVLQQRPGAGSSDMPDAEAEKQAPGRLLLAGLDAFEQVVDALGAQALDVGQAKFIQVVKVGGAGDQLGIDELPDLFGA